MNAITFIKQHGVERAREVVEVAPEGATHIRDSYGFIAYLKDGERKEWYHKNTWLMTLVWQPDCLLSDLKRLVESVELVSKAGGITTSKAQVKQANEHGYLTISIPVEINGSIGMGCLYIDTLEKAIADYEAIYGGEVMRSEFSKWFEQYELNNEYAAEQIALDGYQLGLKQRQTEVDELNQELHLVLKNWNELTKAIHARTNGTAVAEGRQLYEKVDELQKRLAAVTRVLEQKHALVYDRNGRFSDMVECDDVEQALKGGSTNE